MSPPLLAAALVILPLVAGAAPTLAYVCGEPGQQSSSLRFQPADAERAVPPVARFEHLPWAVTRGVMVPGSDTALVVADLRRRRDLSFGAALVRLEPGEEPRLLAEHLVHASRPLITETGRVFIERGQPGPEPTEEEGRRGLLRTDLLTVEEVEPSTGAIRTIHTFSGYATHLAGAYEDSLIVYRVSREGASLIALPMGGGEPRVLVASLPPFAREFSVDASGGRLLFVNADPSSRRWRLESLQLRTLEREVHASSPRPGLSPFAWRGRLYFSPEGNEGLAFFAAELKEVRPLGAGSDHLEARAQEDRWVALSHRRPSMLPDLFVLGAAGERHPVSLPARERCELLGFVEGGVR